MKAKYTVYAVCGMAVLVLSGCSTPTQPTAMVPEIVRSYHRSAQSVAVEVSGGKETSAAGASQISNEDFSEALIRGIERSGVFAEVVQSDAADYQLEAYIGILQQPLMGFSFTVRLEVSYRLVNKATGDVVMDRTIHSSHTTGAGESFAAVTRLRLATEGAARDNIDQLLLAISRLELE
jgi:hypothetical protein